MKTAPYGKTVILKEDAHGVECWNFIGDKTYTLPAGTRLLLEHVNDEDSTTCMFVNEHNEHTGILLRRPDGGEQRGYRFILKNTELNRLADAGLPAKTFDIVGAIMSYEQGDMNQADTLDLFRRLKKDGLLSQLQGHYGREARRLGII